MTESTRCLKLILAYDGARYHGWQVQRSGPTIQSQLENAFKAVTGESVRITASGRTDSGVHAIGQVAGIRTATHLDVSTLHRALNASLPHDIRVRSVEEAASTFHATYDAISKRYRYYIQDGGISDPHLRRTCYFLPHKLDVQAMQSAADFLLGEHDFASYEKAGSPRPHTVRTIHDFVVRREKRELCELVVIEVAANGFLYNMVRNLVGTLIEVGRGRRDVSWPREVLEAKDRKAAGRTAPAHALFLVNVAYDT